MISNSELNLKLNSKINLCHKISISKRINQGLSAAIYKSPDGKILKEIYIDKDINLDRKLNEVYINSIIMNDPELSLYSVPFYGYDGICEKNSKNSPSLKESLNLKNSETLKSSLKSYSLVLEFEDAGKTLYELLPYFNSSEELGNLREIIIKVMTIVKLFNEKGITHNDLHTKNIFYNPETESIRLGDWGLGLFPNKSVNNLYEDLTLFFSSLYLDTVFSKIKTKEVINILQKKNLYKQYMKDVQKEIEYQRRKFSYKPLSFLKSIEDDIKVRFMKRYFVDKVEFRNEILRTIRNNSSNNSLTILKYLESLI